MMLEDGHDRVMSLMRDLFQFFSKTNIVTPVQMKSVSFWTHDKIPYNYYSIQLSYGGTSNANQA